MDPEGKDSEWALQSREVHGVADEQRANREPRADVPEQQGEDAQHGGVREGAEGGKKCTRGGNNCGDVRDDPVSEGVDDTRDRKKREAVTKTRRKRLLEKRTGEGGLKGGKAATAPEAADTDD